MEARAPRGKVGQLFGDYMSMSKKGADQSPYPRHDRRPPRKRDANPLTSPAHARAAAFSTC